MTTNNDDMKLAREVEKAIWTKWEAPSNKHCEDFIIPALPRLREIFKTRLTEADVETVAKILFTTWGHEVDWPNILDGAREEWRQGIRAVFTSLGLYSPPEAKAEIKPGYVCQGFTDKQMQEAIDHRIGASVPRKTCEWKKDESGWWHPKCAEYYQFSKEEYDQCDFCPRCGSEIVEAKEQDKKSRGLYEKFKVTRTDGQSAPGGRHADCEYFVLDLTHDKFAIPAIRAYAYACQFEYKQLAADLFAKAKLRGEAGAK